LDRNPTVPDWLYHLSSKMPLADYVRVQELFERRAWETQLLSDTAGYDSVQTLFDVWGGLNGDEGVPAAEERHQTQIDIGRTDAEIQEILDRNNLGTYFTQGEPVNETPKESFSEFKNEFLEHSYGSRLEIFGGFGLFGLLAALITLLSSLIAATCSPYRASPPPSSPPLVQDSGGEVKTDVFSSLPKIATPVETPPWGGAQSRHSKCKKPKPGRASGKPYHDDSGFGSPEITFEP
jgi:hypothetical protein